MPAKTVRKATRKKLTETQIEKIREYEESVGLTDKDYIEQLLGSSSCPSSWRMVEIEQEVSRGFTADLIDEFLKDWNCIDKYIWVLHDRDFKEDMKTPREPHIHLLLRFTGAVPTVNLLMRLVKIFGRGVILPQQLEKIKAWSSAVNYLTHRDEKDKPWKHVYDISDLHLNFDFELEAEKGHAAKQLKFDKGILGTYIKMIDNGELTPYNVAEKLSFEQEVVYTKELQNAFRIHLKRRMKGEREMEVIFVEGASGVGKDTFAVQWCKDKGLDYYRTNNNTKFPFDDYEGQPVIIWSDARDDQYKPRELHNLLDNHYNSKQSARYADKYICARYMIITSIKPLKTWYRSCYEKEHEDPFQLYRRVGTLVHMEQDTVSISTMDFELRDYVEWCTIPNTFRYADVAKKSREEQKELVKSFLGGFAKAATFVADNIDNEALIPRYSLQDFCSCHVPSLMFGGDCPASIKVRNEDGFDLELWHRKFIGDEGLYVDRYIILDMNTPFKETDTDPVWHIVP